VPLLSPDPVEVPLELSSVPSSFVDEVVLVEVVGAELSAWARPAITRPVPAAPATATPVAAASERRNQRRLM